MTGFTRPGSVFRVIEKWKNIPGYEGYYQVSDQGQIRSLDRVVKGGPWGTQTVKGQVIATTTRTDGYAAVHLRREGKRTKHLVHRFVLEAFVGPCPEGAEARHLNDVKGDPRLENLEWGTRSENNLDRTRNGINHYRNRKECPRGHPLEGDNLMPSQLKNGHRSCLACSRAISVFKLYPDLKPHIQVIGDIHYRNIIGPKRRLSRSDYPL